MPEPRGKAALPVSRRQGLLLSLVCRPNLLLIGTTLLLSWAVPAIAQFGVDPNRRYDQNTYLGTHNAYSNRAEGWITPNQEISIVDQLNRGVRLINLDIHLVRQGVYLVPLFFVPIPRVIVYDDVDVSPPSDRFWLYLGPLETVVAHQPDSSQYLLRPPPFKRLDAVFGDLRAWLDQHPAEVVTIYYESTIHDAHQDWVVNDYRNSGLESTLFYLDRPNEGCTVPNRPAGEWWDVTKHGFPTLSELVGFGKRIVLLPDDDRPGYPTPWRFQVSTVYGSDSLDSDTWMDYRSESAPIDDFTRPLFFVEHAPLGAGLYPTTDLNPYQDMHKFNEGSTDLQNRWDRMPHFLVVDFFAHDTVHPSGNATEISPSGPMGQTVAYNLIWRNTGLPEVTASSPNINAWGWSRGDVEVLLAGHYPDNSQDTVRTLISCLYGKEQAPLTTAGRYVLTQEGRSTVSAAAIGAHGVRGEQFLFDIKIDRTAPDLLVTGNAGRYAADQMVNIVCSASDALSGIQSLAPASLAEEAFNYGVGPVTIDAVATDYADNSTVVPIRFEVVVTYESLINLTGRFVSNAGVANALLQKLQAARRAVDRGDLDQKAQHIEIHIHTLKIHVGRFVTEPDAALLERLARAW
ncbi:MAG: hypothetical protein L0Z50_14280 [Verrucomicrobiales bacterium]|nr:hypothetical protein [Verrucomicrobiales bacterium]